MGEKIRDIHSIKIGKSSLMIELNEGYSASQGRVIHIQNQKFRYLLTENDFYKFSAMILRSWSEFKYIKEKWAEKVQQKDFKDREPISHQSYLTLQRFIGILVNEGVEYRILDFQNKMLSVIVNQKYRRKLSDIIREERLVELYHPLGKEKGYKFLYQMDPFILTKYENLYIEVFSQLPCASLTPKTWIPLDRVIQKRVWQQRCVERDILWVDNICKYIFHLCWAVFVNLGFSPFEKQYLMSNKQILDSLEFPNLLSLVFFKFSQELISLLKEDKFEAIIPSYYKFVDY